MPGRVRGRECVLWKREQDGEREAENKSRRELCFIPTCRKASDQSRLTYRAEHLTEQSYLFTHIAELPRLNPKALTTPHEWTYLCSGWMKTS